MNIDIRPFKKRSISSVQYSVFFSSLALNQTRVLSTLDSGGIGRKPNPKKALIIIICQKHNNSISYLDQFQSSHRPIATQVCYYPKFDRIQPTQQRKIRPMRHRTPSRRIKFQLKMQKRKVNLKKERDSLSLAKIV